MRDLLLDPAASQAGSAGVGFGHQPLALPCCAGLAVGTQVTEVGTEVRTEVRTEVSSSTSQVLDEDLVTLGAAAGPGQVQGRS